MLDHIASKQVKMPAMPKRKQHAPIFVSAKIIRATSDLLTTANAERMRLLKETPFSKRITNGGHRGTQKLLRTYAVVNLSLCTRTQNMEMNTLSKSTIDGNFQ
jgi:hypothetical protein